MAPTSVPPPERHFGYICTNCHAAEFTGRRYGCWVCSDYQICGNCYDAGQFPVTPEHRYFHPLEAHYTRAEYELYFGGENYVAANVPQSYKCALCDVCGLTCIELYSHLSEMHRDHSDFVEYFNIFLRRFGVEPFPTADGTDAPATGGAGAVAILGPQPRIVGGDGEGNRGDNLEDELSGPGAGAGDGAEALSRTLAELGGGAEIETGAPGAWASAGPASVGRGGLGGGLGSSTGAGTGAGLRAGARARAIIGAGGSARRIGVNPGRVDRADSARTGGSDFWLDATGISQSRGGSRAAVDSQRNVLDQPINRRHDRDDSRPTSFVGYRRFSDVDFLSDILALPPSQRTSFLAPSIPSENRHGNSRRSRGSPRPSAGLLERAGSPRAGSFYFDTSVVYPSRGGSRSAVDLQRNAVDPALDMLYSGDDLPPPRSFPGYIPFSDEEFFDEIEERPQSGIFEAHHQLQQHRLLHRQRRQQQEQQQHHLLQLHLQPQRQRQHGHTQQLSSEPRYTERLNVCSCNHARKDRNHRTCSRMRGQSNLHRFLCARFLGLERSQQCRHQQLLPSESNRGLFAEAILCSMLADDQLNPGPTNGPASAKLLLNAAEAHKAMLAAKYPNEPCDQQLVRGGDVIARPAGTVDIMDRFYKNLDLFNDWLADFSIKRLEQDSQLAAIPDVLLAIRNPVAEDIGLNIIIDGDGGGDAVAAGADGDGDGVTINELNDSDDSSDQKKPEDEDENHENIDIIEEGSEQQQQQQQQQQHHGVAEVGVEIDVEIDVELDVDVDLDVEVDVEVDVQVDVVEDELEVEVDDEGEENVAGGEDGEDGEEGECDVEDEDEEDYDAQSGSETSESALAMLANEFDHVYGY